MLDLKLKLRTKIVLWFITLVILEGVLLTISIDSLVTTELKNMFKSRGIKLSESLMVQSRDLVLTGDIINLHALFQKERETNQGLRYVFILDSQGKVIAHTFREGIPEVLLSVHSLRDQGNSYRFIKIGNEFLYDFQRVEEWGTLRLGLSIHEVETAVNKIRNYVMFAILTSIIVVFALALTISRPVEKLATFVAKATAEDMPGVDPSILTTLETSKLCEVFSNVMGELRRKIRELTESEKTIRVQKDYIENLHNNLGLAIVVVNVKKGKIEFTNRIAGEQLGITTGGDIEEFSKFKPFKDEDSLTRLILRGCLFKGFGESEKGYTK